MLWKQIAKDIRKEWSWAVFYVIVTTITLMAVLYLSISFSSVKKQSSIIRSFIDKNVVIFEFMTTQMKPAVDNSDQFEQKESNSGDILDYLQNNLSAAGKAGSYVFVANDGYADEKYEQILILFGKYSSLLDLKYDSQMALYVPEKDKNDIDNHLSVAGQKIKVVNFIDPNFSLFHPLSYFEAGNPMLTKTLVLCTRDFSLVQRMFPWWRLHDEVFGRMVLVNPTDEEVLELQNMMYKRYGRVYKGISTEDFTKITTVASMRAHRLYVWFYVMSGLLLLLLLLLNIIRLIEVHVAEYTINHLYGAPIHIIQRRVGGFVLVLNTLPVIGMVYVLTVNNMELWYLLLLIILLIIFLYMFAARYTKNRIGTLNSLENLRRDY
ncbi:hypothetical protein ABB02_02097 [Clostridiaceae bacterium JG1575]|nr:hypothetical protein ABB02_02097 [Clostridiaceae bacterium JG1575]